MTTLRYMRQEFKRLKWALWLVIFVFVALIFVDWGMGRAQAQQQGNYVATVAGEPISPTEYYRAYENQREMYRQAYGDRFNEDLMKQMNLSEGVVRELVRGKMLRAEAAAAGLAVPPADVTQEITAMKVFQKEDGSFVGFDTYKRVLAANNMTPSYFEARMNEDLLQKRYGKLLAGAMAVSEAEVREEFKKRNLTAKVDYAYLAEATLQGQVTVTEAEAKAYYEAHPTEFWQPEKRKINYLLVDQQKLKAGLQVSEQEVADYYDTHSEEFRTDQQVQARHILVKTDTRSEAEARALADAARARLARGEDFAAVAKQVSEDPGSKDKGGDLGFFGKGQMVAEFENAAFSLPAGEISEPVKTMYGFHVIQVLEQRAAGLQALAEVAGTIRNKIQDEKAAQEALGKSRRVERQIIDDGLKTDEDLKRLTEVDPALTFNTTEYFGLADFIPGIGRIQEVNNAIFAMQEGGLTPMLKIQRGYMVGRLAGISPVGVAAFPAVKREAENGVKRQKALALAKSRMAAAVPQGLEAAAKALNITVSKDQTVRYLSPLATLGSGRGLHEAIFNAAPGALVGPVEVQGGYALFQVNLVDRFDESKYQAQKTEIRNSLGSGLATQLMDVLLEAQKERFDVRVNTEFLKQYS
jgi:peptidyl-prolyl cis-trans isomerase D